MTPSVRFRGFILFGLLAITAACKDAAGPTIDPVGTWTGTTSQGRALTFTVTSAGITQATFSYQINGSFCSTDVEFSVGGSPVPIQNNAFDTVFDSFESTFTVKGKFNSSSSASGTLRIDDSYCNGTLNANWSATK